MRLITALSLGLFLAYAISIVIDEIGQMDKVTAEAEYIETRSENRLAEIYDNMGVSRDQIEKGTN